MAGATNGDGEGEGEGEGDGFHIFFHLGLGLLLEYDSINSQTWQLLSIEWENH